MEKEKNNNVLNTSIHFSDLRNAIKFLITNKGSRPQNIDKTQLKQAIEFIFKYSIQNGLSSDFIKTLAFTIIFDDQYDITTRRKLLYSCVPESIEFPYQVIPLAISSAAIPNTSSTWQYSILSWIAGLLEYHLIDDSNKYVHTCYTTLFNMLDNLRLCGVICKILHQITRLEDVTSCRTKILLKLERKNGFSFYVANLIRIFKLYRPDLIVSRLDHVRRYPSFPKWYHESLLNAKSRLQDADHVIHQNLYIWPAFAGSRKLNPFHDPEVIPQPEILVYAENIEEKKEKKISVLQYKRINEMIKQLPQWENWRWPNNVPCLLWKPSAISLFKPHDPYVKIAITNWLELALRTEIIEQWGNPSIHRQENLLDACILLVKQTETLVPAVYHFLIEFLTKWDKYSHMPRVLEIISFIPFISPTIFFEGILEHISHIMTTASLPLFCAMIDALSNLTASWSLQEFNEKSNYKNAGDWPLNLNETNPLEGIYFLSQRLERIFLGGILRFGPHPLLLNSCLSYYNKINLCCEELRLPLFIVPPVEVLLVILTSADVVATHRLGLFLVRLQDRVKFVKEYEATGDEKLMRSVILATVECVNFCLFAYLDSTVTSLGFSERWKETLVCFVGQSYWRQLTAVSGLKYFGTVFRALPYLPLSCEYFENSAAFENKNLRNEVVNHITAKLKTLQLNGIESCARTYIT